MLRDYFCEQYAYFIESSLCFFQFSFVKDFGPRKMKLFQIKQNVRLKAKLKNERLI